MVNKKEYDKKYYRDNKVRRDLKTKLWCIANKERRKEYLHEHYIKNKSKYSTLSKKRYLKNKDSIRRKQKIYLLKVKYNLTNDEYKKMKKDQHNECYICNRKLPLKIDHDHKTGKVRKLLCNNCNLLIGLCNESISILENSILYLKRHNLCGPRERIGGNL